MATLMTWSLWGKHLKGNPQATKQPQESFSKQTIGLFQKFLIQKVHCEGSANRCPKYSGCWLKKLSPSQSPTALTV
jgi:hypothetical protein